MARDVIAAVLGPGGLLARAIEGYEDRPQQLEMARVVRRALDERRMALIEAGTGTGKTLGYLLPAVLSGRKVVISTATKNLQEQILKKDIPLLREAAALDFSVAVLKGRSNYLCMARLEAVEQDPTRLLPTKQDVKALPLISRWAEETEDGDRAELDIPDNLALWREVSATSETCTGQACARYEECFVTRMRKKAAESDLIVVNHHLFFADLALKAQKGAHGAEVIPRYDAVVFDEAHAIEDVATEFFGVGASAMRVDDLLADAERLVDEDGDALANLSPIMGRLELLGQDLFREVERLIGRESSVRLTPTITRRLQAPTQDLVDGLKAFKGALGGLEGAEAQALVRRAGEIADDVDFLVRANEPGFVYWAEARGRGRFLRAAPIDVSRTLQEQLYRQAESVVFTSATLAAQGRFDFVKARLGLVDTETGEDRYAVDELLLDSPFDYATQAVLYTPAHLPEPTDPAFVSRAAEEIYALTRITGGRAFALFTSIRNMNEAHRLLKDRLPFRVLLQGEKPKHLLLQEFREMPSVLFASHSFWEGVDIAGDALSLVVIDKLPFASPGDPVVAARIDLLKSKNEDAFGGYQVPLAAITLRQGFGRLIRTRQDRGVVAILDRRLSTKSYGRSFLESLPKAPRVQQLDAVSRWWQQGAKAGQKGEGTRGPR